MPVHCEQDEDGNWRLVERDGSIATTENDSARDGGGHSTESKCNRQARAINSNSDDKDARRQGTPLMARKLHKTGEQSAREWIDSGRVDTESEWSFDADDGDRLLGSDGADWDRFASVHLGEDTDASEQTKERYSFPVAKLKDGDSTPTVFRSGVIAARSRAGQTGDDEIFEAAGRLLERIDDRGDVSARRRSARSARVSTAANGGRMTHLPRIASRLFNQPHAITPQKLHSILWALRDRFGAQISVEQPSALDGGGSSSDRAGFAVSGGVAVIPVHGTLVQKGDSLDAESGLLGYDRLIHQVEAAEARSDVSAILLDIDSAGGEVAGLLDTADRINAASRRIPMAALANECACSAAYVIAASAGRVWATQGATVGSIGVIMAHVDETRANQSEGVEVTELFAGARKADGSPHHELADDERSRLQGFIDQWYGMLVAKTASFRPVSEDAIRAQESGVFLQRDRFDQGLIDGEANFEAALESLAPSSVGLQANSKEQKTMTKGTQSGVSAGTHLASKLDGAMQQEVDRRMGHESEDRDRNDVHEEVMGEVAAISVDENGDPADMGTVRGAASGEVSCPPLPVITGFASTLGVDESSLVEAAEQDGCSPRASGDGAQACSPSQEPADPADVADLCAKNGVSDMASTLIREKVSYTEAQNRVQDLGAVWGACLRASRINGSISAEKKYGELKARGVSSSQARAELFEQMAGNQEDGDVSSTIKPDASNPAVSEDPGWDRAFASASGVSA